MSLSEEILVLFAGSKGYLDKLPVERIKAYEPEVLNYVKSKYPEIMSEIEDKKVISPELEKKMKDALSEFEGIFVAG